MAVPKQKISPSRRGQRRSHDKLKAVKIVDNEKGNPTRPHHMNLEDGTYKGRQIVTIKQKLSPEIAAEQGQEPK